MAAETTTDTTGVENKMEERPTGGHAASKADEEPISSSMAAEVGRSVMGKSYDINGDLCDPDYEDEFEFTYEVRSIYECALHFLLFLTRHNCS